MSTEIPALLRLIWLASPALPIGAFSYSEVLESAVEHGLVSDEASAADWLGQQLELLARGDLAALADLIPAWQAQDWDRLQALAQWLRSTRDSAEARLQSEQMGQSLLQWLRQQDLAPDAALAWLGEQARQHGAPPYMVVMGLALSGVEAPLAQALQAQAFGWAENQVQAALKAVPLGQAAGQRVLAALAARIPAAVAQAIATPLERRQVFAPRLSILAARHETQYSRLFRS